MNHPPESRSMPDPLVSALLMLVAFSLPITIAVSEAAAFLLLPVWLLRRYQGRVPAIRWGGFGFLMALFLSAAVMASFMGWHPGYSLWKLTRFALVLSAFAIPTLQSESPVSWARRLSLAYIGGCTLKAAFDCVRIPWEAFGDSARAGSYWRALIDQGNMREPQFYMVAILLLLALRFSKGGDLRARWFAPVLSLLLCAFVLHAKIGCILGTAIGALVLILLGRNVRFLVFTALAAVVILAWPPTRLRIQEKVHSVRSALELVRPCDVAGPPPTAITNDVRLMMWNAALYRLYQSPFGIGWKAWNYTRGGEAQVHLLYDDVWRALAARGVSGRLMERQSHCHNNVLQVAVDFGWIGLCTWLAWMLGALCIHIRAWRVSRGMTDGSHALAVGLLAAFVGLLANGMIEYNFGDTEIFILFVLIWGCAAAIPRVAGAGAHAR